ncbi:BlaI/MecI/CopY family transcriptional regulator [Streptomyces sp. NPDC048664]|uniref:BlaI/MecI/CopY family transcriptional regulator n=1 Tax=Streptomyces sp. NPDC048664 TaxID=3154505 RepID=UPI00342DCC37
MAGTGAQGRAERRSAGELESEVLATLWAAPRSLTPAEIQAAINGGLAYNTVHTILRRLTDKGLVLRDVDGRRGAYRPAKNAAELTAETMHEALCRGPDPTAALQHFVGRLSPEEEQTLRDLLCGNPRTGADLGGSRGGHA